MPHQKKALVYAKPLARIALFMEMRLGKTLVAIRWAEFWKRKRILIVCPLAVLPVWREELLKEEWAEEDIVLIRGSAEERAELSRPTSSGQWFIINYEALLASPFILDEKWDCIILDESTKIRDPQANITKLLNCRNELAPCRAILSGHPAPEFPLDYFEQIRFLFSHLLHCHNYWQFRNRWFRKVGYEWYCSKFVREKIRTELHQHCFFLSRKEAGIESKKVYEKRFVELTETQLNLMQQIEEGFEYELDDEAKQTKWVPVQYLWYSRIAGGFTPDGKLLSDAKFKEVLGLVKGDLKDEPVVVWFRYDNELRFVASGLAKKNIKVGTFTGSDKSDSKLFMDGKIQVLCAQGKCGQYGLDWSRSSTAIYYSNWYDGEIRVQSEDRIIHPKKRDTHLFLDLVAEGSIDEEVVRILASKKRNAKALSAREFNEELRERWEKRKR
jgi:SNF2 family DNA or RNA helicase